MTQSWTWWLGFNSLVLAMLAVDLSVFQRRAHEVRFCEALLRSMVWVTAALLVFTGLKLLAEPLFGFHINPGLSLVIIGSILAITVVWSLLAPSAPRPAARPAGLRAGGDKR